MAVIGEGPSSETIDASKKLTAQRKKEEKLRVSVLTTLNQNILLSDSVTVDRQESALDDTQPIGDAATPTEDKSNNSIGNDSSNIAVKDIGIENVTTTNVEHDKENPIVNESESRDNEKEPKGDDTVDLSCTKETQTPKLHILCLCETCQGEFLYLGFSLSSSLNILVMFFFYAGVVADFINIVQQGSSQHCTSKSLLQVSGVIKQV